MSTKHKHGVTAQQLAQGSHRHPQQPHQVKPTHPSGQTATVDAVGHAAKARQRDRHKSKRLHIPWLPISLLVLGGLIVAALIAGGLINLPPQGTLAATNTSHDFGTVAMKGGNITTQFPLTVQGDARAVDITST